jgi:hypothetical protein
MEVESNAVNLSQDRAQWQNHVDLVCTKCGAYLHQLTDCGLLSRDSWLIRQPVWGDVSVFDTHVCAECKNLREQNVHSSSWTTFSMFPCLFCLLCQPRFYRECSVAARPLQSVALSLSLSLSLQYLYSCWIHFVLLYQMCSVFSTRIIIREQSPVASSYENG